MRTREPAVEFLFFSWDYRVGNNVEKITRNGLTLDDVEAILNDPDDEPA